MIKAVVLQEIDKQQQTNTEKDLQISVFLPQEGKALHRRLLQFNTHHTADN